MHLLIALLKISSVEEAIIFKAKQIAVLSNSELNFPYLLLLTWKCVFGQDSICGLACNSELLKKQCYCFLGLGKAKWTLLIGVVSVRYKVVLLTACVFAWWARRISVNDWTEPGHASTVIVPVSVSPLFTFSSAHWHCSQWQCSHSLTAFPPHSLTLCSHRYITDPKEHKRGIFGRERQPSSVTWSACSLFIVSTLWVSALQRLDFTWRRKCRAQLIEQLNIFVPLCSVQFWLILLILYQNQYLLLFYLTNNLITSQNGFSLSLHLLRLRLLEWNSRWTNKGVPTGGCSSHHNGRHHVRLLPCSLENWP